MCVCVYGGSRSQFGVVSLLCGRRRHVIIIRILRTAYHLSAEKYRTAVDVYNIYTNARIVRIYGINTTAIIYGGDILYAVVIIFLSRRTTTALEPPAGYPTFATDARFGIIIRSIGSYAGG